MKRKKIIHLTLAMLILHILISILYIPFSSVTGLNNEMTSFKIFLKGFNSFYLALLFPYGYSLYWIIKKGNVV